jgi:hypothetical protein
MQAQGRQGWGPCSRLGALLLSLAAMAMEVAGDTGSGESAMKLTNNLVQYQRTKHIDVHHHFIRDHQ